MSNLFPNFKEMDIETAPGVKIHLETGGSGEPLLLVHGYPETHVMWHKVAPALAKRFTLVIPDLRGYGDSSCPDGGKDHEAYSKLEMARDLVSVMEQLGYSEFFCCGHDRGARVCFRLAMEFPGKVRKCSLLDIVPELDLYRGTDEFFARGYFHWFFLIQPELPELLIGADPAGFLRNFAKFDRRPDIFAPEAVKEYERSFMRPEVVYGTCEDYRAGAGTDLAMQEKDLKDGRKISVPLLVMYGQKGLIARYAPEKNWPRWAADPKVISVPDCGHFIPEEKPEFFIEHLTEFLCEQ